MECARGRDSVNNRHPKLNNSNNDGCCYLLLISLRIDAQCNAFFRLWLFLLLCLLPYSYIYICLYPHWIGLIKMKRASTYHNMLVFPRRLFRLSSISSGPKKPEARTTRKSVISSTQHRCSRWVRAWQHFEALVVFFPILINLLWVCDFSIFFFTSFWLAAVATIIEKKWFFFCRQIFLCGWAKTKSFMKSIWGRESNQYYLCCLFFRRNQHRIVRNGDASKASFREKNNNILESPCFAIRISIKSILPVFLFYFYIIISPNHVALCDDSSALKHSICWETNCGSTCAQVYIRQHCIPASTAEKNGRILRMM